MKSFYKLSQKYMKWTLMLSAYDFCMMYCKKTMNFVNESSQRTDYWQEIKAENVIIKHHSILKKILFSTAMTVTENEQSVDINHKVYIQIYI